MHLDQLTWIPFHLQTRSTYTFSLVLTQVFDKIKERNPETHTPATEEAHGCK